MTRPKPKPEDFRRRHLSEWMPEPWLRLAYETWDQYDTWADRLESFRWGKPPKFLTAGAPPGVTSFQGLMHYVADGAFWTAKVLGYPGAPEQWRREVHRAGRDR